VQRMLWDWMQLALPFILAILHQPHINRSTEATEGTECDAPLLSSLFMSTVTYVQPLWHIPANLKRPSPEKLSHVIATNIRVIRTKLKGNIWKGAGCGSLNRSREMWRG
jgi:hypothetical protein